jgi:SNF2 family DNA or RNA helicase
MYSCEARVQSEDRIIHPQKKTPLLYIDLVSKGTIEEDVLKILQRKKIGSKAFMVDLKEEFEARLQKEAQQDEL